MKVIFKEHSKSDGSILAEIQLNRPQALNALDLEMCVAMRTQLEKWRDDSRISLVFLHGVLRESGTQAFCAGGDVKSLYSSVVSAMDKGGDDLPSVVQPFFENEYCLDYLLHNYPKMVVVWGEGLVMGGGLGLFLAGSHRIVTETSCLAMPEIAIGFFPDVGSSYILSRLPHHLGWYLALTGYRLNHIESHFLGLSHFYFNGVQKEKVFQTLLSAVFHNKDELSGVLKDLERPLSQQKGVSGASDKWENWLEKNQIVIEEVMSSHDPNVIFQQFQNIDVHQNQDKKSLHYQKAFLQGSPIAIGITCELLKRAKNHSLKEVFCTDLIVALHCMEGHDFREGVDRRLISKTGLPEWKPSTIEQVTKSDIDKYFAPFSNWSHPLKSL